MDQEPPGNEYSYFCRWPKLRLGDDMEHLPLRMGVVLTAALLLTLVSFVVVSMNATYEPFGVFNMFDAILYVVIASMLVTLWLIILGNCVIKAIRFEIGVLFLLLALWSVILIFFLSTCIGGYLSNVENLMIP